MERVGNKNENEIVPSAGSSGGRHSKRTVAVLIAFLVTLAVGLVGPSAAGAHGHEEYADETSSSGESVDALLSSPLAEYIVGAFLDTVDAWNRASGLETSARLVLFVEDAPPECPATGPAAYCPANDTIVVRASDAAIIADVLGEFAVAMVVAHEYGHNIQTELQLPINGVVRELQADCFAGAWAADANRRGLVPDGAFNQALDLFSAIGGPAHGTGQDRRDAVLAGWMHGAELCIFGPLDLDSHYNRGVVLSELGRYEEAVEAYDRAIDVDPTNVGAHFNRGSALNNLGRYEEAVEAYDRVLELDPNNAGARYNRDLILYELGRE